MRLLLPLSLLVSAAAFAQVPAPAPQAPPAVQQQGAAPSTQPSAAPTAPQQPPAATQQQAGAPSEASLALWKKKCASCHGEDGKADTKIGKKSRIDDLSRERWQQRHSDAFVRKTIREGVKGTRMGSYKDKLSADEIEGLIQVIRSLRAPSGQAPAPSAHP